MNGGPKTVKSSRKCTKAMLDQAPVIKWASERMVDRGAQLQKERLIVNSNQ